MPAPTDAYPPQAVKIVSVRCFEIFDAVGNSLGLFRVDSEWKGLTCLKSLDDKEQVIVRTPPKNIFEGIFGEHRCISPLVMATPEIAERLKAQHGEPPT